MPKVIYIDHNDTETEVEVENGANLMQAALDNMVSGILGDCGGDCACATCHVFVDSKWQDEIDAPSELEEDLLDGLIDPQPNSRLSCQIVMEDKLDGIVLRLPESQY
ncbi:2Fe-2S iron-sulfur cluster binding domain-containing protein [Aestuariicella hydrocarbonica]|uniref:2Fe-2S iron-sulfur cluster binding domain-containing protein n=1 Tax=Pseudomaricurvus hydrocarbonicus TaxID=1470433 RepID=A0A9E5MQN7_9GAMM|nr:2Fe-2S iron-sulfur cluster-binding protein [Aestuariicella hydrocarbonica]NHO68542.1 2Fe-2S iron-sulfur cluster binding domain-containing protein [Aestuariicella hydrocarbonica]